MLLYYHLIWCHKNIIWCQCYHIYPAIHRIVRSCIVMCVPWWFIVTREVIFQWCYSNHCDNNMGKKNATAWTCPLYKECFFFLMKLGIYQMAFTQNDVTLWPWTVLVHITIPSSWSSSISNNQSKASCCGFPPNRKIYLLFNWMGDKVPFTHMWSALNLGRLIV